MTTQILGITELVENQAQAYATVNEAVANLERAHNRTVEWEVTDDPDTETLSLQTVFRNAYVRVIEGTPAPSSADLIVPRHSIVAPIVPSTPKINRILWIKNELSFDATIRIEDMVIGDALAFAAGELACFHFNDDTVTKLTSVQTSSSNAEVPVFVSGAWPGTGEVFRYNFVRRVSLGNDFAGSVGSVENDPAATVTIDVLRNGTSIGEIEISTGGVFSFDTTGSGVEVFESGDVLTLETSSAGTGMTNMSVTFAGNA